MIRTLTLLLLVTLAACGGDKSSTPIQAMANGLYTVVGPVCKSTAQDPSYPNATSSAALYKFTDTEYTLLISGGTAEQTFVDSDCTLKMARELSINSDGYLGFREKRDVTSNPEACELSVVHDDTTFPFSAAAPVLAASEDTSVEILFNVQRQEDQKFTLTSRDANPDNRVWSSFGCADTDQIVYTLSQE